MTHDQTAALVLRYLELRDGDSRVGVFVEHPQDQSPQLLADLQSATSTSGGFCCLKAFFKLLLSHGTVFTLKKKFHGAPPSKNHTKRGYLHNNDKIVFSLICTHSMSLSLSNFSIYVCTRNVNYFKSVLLPSTL